MLDEIRRRLARQPFRPFDIYLADGRMLSVPHPEFVWLPKLGMLYHLSGAEMVGERINPLLIVSIKTQATSASKAPRKFVRQ